VIPSWPFVDFDVARSSVVVENILIAMFFKPCSTLSPHVCLSVRGFLSSIAPVRKIYVVNVRRLAG
jgi:hypothetical protein